MDELALDGHENESSNELSRRVFVKGLGFVTVGLILGTIGGCDLDKLLEAIANRPTRRWLRTGSAEVDADIATYRDGVKLMKDLDISNPADPRSWKNQAGIHGTVAGGFKFCQHYTPHFFDWHRVYLLNFERIIQKLTGKPKWGLPYWNWNQTPDIHSAFQDASSALFHPRDNNTMTGEPSGAVTTATLDPIIGDTNFFSFSSGLEDWPHGTVHVWIGQDMGSGGSPLDPIFWPHHGMIDYCWAKWNLELGNNNPNDPTWTNTNDEHFVDADGNPMSMTAGLTPILPLISYQYESSAIGSSLAAAAVRTKSAYEKLKQRIERGANIRFDIKRRIPITERATVSIAKPVSKETKVAAADMAAIINSNTAQEKIFVTVEFAQLPPTSDFIVRVFINLPNANSSTPQSDPHFAGAFAFFGTETATATHPMDQPGHQPKFLVNITNTLQNLRRTQQLKESEPISVQLVPVPFHGKFEREDTQLVLNRIEIIITPVTVKDQQ